MEKKILVITGIVNVVLFGLIGVYFMSKAATLSSVISLEEGVWPLGLLFGPAMIVYGSIMPRLKSGRLIGLRTPWTVSGSDEVWNKSQRFAGAVAIIFGVIIVALSFIVKGEAGIIAILAPCMIWVIMSAVASYVFYRQEVKNEKK